MEFSTDIGERILALAAEYPGLSAEDFIVSAGRAYVHGLNWDLMDRFERGLLWRSPLDKQAG